MAVLNSKTLCMVTYLRNTESFTDDLNAIAEALFDFFHQNFKVVICCEEEYHLQRIQHSYPIECFYSKGTKYNRLFSLMRHDKADYYLSIDNDIKGDIASIKSFLVEMISGPYDIGWGRIRSLRMNTLISNMVAVDKLISHNFLRPLLWKVSLGISVPGQIFCLKSSSYVSKQIEFDTYLDDLAIGLYTAQKLKCRLNINKVLGYETPNVSFGGLWKQRQRWALGYATIFKSTNDLPGVFLLLIHAFSYHCSWMIHWLIILLLSRWGLIIPSVFVLLWAFIFSMNSPRLFLYAIIYQFIFPIFHIGWIFALIKFACKEN